MNKIPFTKEGLLKLQSEYDILVKNRIPAVLDLKSARDKGDLSENAAYRVARSKLSSIDNRLRRLKAILDKAYVLDNRNLEFVDIGSYVEVEAENQTKQIFRIVNTFESDISKNQISSFSPIGKALLGKKVKDKVIITIPSGTKTYIVKSISLEA